MNWMAVDYWETKDGRKLYPKDFEDSHLINTISFIEKRGKDIKLGRELEMLMLPQPRGDMAQMCFEEEVLRSERMTTEEWLSYNCDIYNLLCDERDSRGI